MQQLRKALFFAFAFLVLISTKSLNAQARDTYKKNCFFYQNISKRQQEIYRKAWSSSGDIYFSVPANNYSLNDVYVGMQAFLLDFPECQYEKMEFGTSGNILAQKLWISSEDKDTEFVVYTVDFKKSKSRPEETVTKKLDQLSKKITSKKTASEEEKARLIHDTVCKYLAYASSESANVYDALVKKETQCGGYAKLFQVLCRNAGLAAIYVPGNVGEGRYHAWNMVKIGKTWYEVDCCYDDTTNPDGSISYNYFLKSERQMDGHNIMLDPALVWNSENCYYGDLIDIYPSSKGSLPYQEPGDIVISDDRKAEYFIKNYKEVYLLDWMGNRKICEIPASVKIKGRTYQVTGIEDGAFCNDTKIKKIIFKGKKTAKTDFHIGADALYGTIDLEILDLRKAGTIKKIGDSAFTKSGISYSGIKITADKKIRKKIKNQLNNN